MANVVVAVDCALPSVLHSAKLGHSVGNVAVAALLLTVPRATALTSLHIHDIDVVDPAFIATLRAVLDAAPHLTSFK